MQMSRSILPLRMSGRLSALSRDGSDAYVAFLSQQRQKNVGTTPGLTLLGEDAATDIGVSLFERWEGGTNERTNERTKQTNERNRSS